MLYAARITSGLAVGAISVIAPIYICEVAEKSVRGALGYLFFIMLNIGQLFMFVIQGSVNYIWTAAIFALIPVIYALALLTVPESPTYLIKRDGKDEAKKSLQYFRGPQYDTGKEMDDLENEVNQSAQRNFPIRDLIFSPGPRKAFIIAVGLMLLQVFCGVNLVLASVHSVFASEYRGENDEDITLLTLFFVEVFAAFLSSTTVDRSGRRPLLFISSSVMTLSLIVIGTYFNVANASDWFPRICVFAFIGAFSLGVGPIPWVMAGEMFSVNVKWLGSSVAVCLYWTFRFVLQHVLWNDLYALGEDVLCWAFACVCISALFFVYFLVPETKGRSLLEIQSILERDGPESCKI
jgi:SP family facilitated glucose transporter-like MFS transporter 8